MWFFPDNFVGRAFDDFLDKRENLDTSPFEKYYRSISLDNYKSIKGQYAIEYFTFFNLSGEMLYETLLTKDLQRECHSAVGISTRRTDVYHEILDFLTKNVHFSELKSNDDKIIFEASEDANLPYRENMEFLQISINKNANGNMVLFHFNMRVLFRSNFVFM